MPSPQKQELLNRNEMATEKPEGEVFIECQAL